MNLILTPTDEIRSIRQRLSAEFGHDVHRIAMETRRRQRESGRIYISLPKRDPHVLHLTSQAMPASIEVR